MPLAQLAAALAHQRVVGAPGREAEARLARQPLDHGGQVGDLAEQLRFVGGAGSLEAFAELGELAFDGVELAGHRAGDREREHGHHAIHLDVEQALHLAAGVRRAGVDVEHEESGVALRV